MTDIRIIGDVIEIDGIPAATITLSVSSLRDKLEWAIDPYKVQMEPSTKMKGKTKDYEEGYNDGYEAAKDDAYVAFN